MTSKGSLLRYGGLVAALLAPIAPQARAETVATVDVALEGTAASNPFLLTGDDTGALAAGVRIDPALFFNGALTTAALTGSARFDQYDHRYGTEEAFRLGGALQHRVSERLSLGANIGFQSSRSAIRDFLVNPIVPELPDIPNPDVEIPDVSAAGRRVRTTSFFAGASVSRILSPVETFSLGANVGFSDIGEHRDDLDAGFGRDSRRASISPSYTRQLSERTSARVTVHLGGVDYEGGKRGDGIYVTPLVGVEHQLGQSLNAELEVGASFLEVKGVDGRKSHSTTLAGNFRLCQAQARGRLCATAARSAQPTVLGGLTSVTSAAVTYTRDLTARDQIELSGRYGRTDSTGSELEGVGVENDVFAAAASYNRQFDNRLTAFVRPSFARIVDDGRDQSRNNYQVIAGIAYRFGRVR